MEHPTCHPSRADFPWTLDRLCEVTVLRPLEGLIQGGLGLVREVPQEGAWREGCRNWGGAVSEPLGKSSKAEAQKRVLEMERAADGLRWS